ncbi:MAG: glycosyltransferase family 2 protein [Lachnospiraceae bacterium]|nr:glycosyltransferase family 2 protein [Lachnospiraceae bacterium]
MFKIDVIIPTYKPDQKFIQLIQMLEKQTVPVHKIIVLNTEEKYFERLIYGTHFLEHYKNLLVVSHHSVREFDHGKTRDRGVKCSDADIFVCMTQDAVPKDEYMLEELVKPFSDDAVAAVYARQLADDNAGVIERFIREFNYPPQSSVKEKKDIERLGIKAFFCSNVCAAYRRTCYDKVGGFIRHAIFNEDMIYAANAISHDYKVAYAAEAEVIHSHNYTNMQQFRRNFDIGVSQAQHPEVFASVPSEGEGMKLVKMTIQHLKETHNTHRIPGFVVNCGCKFIGYRLGKMYRLLPAGLVLKCTMNKHYWEHEHHIVLQNR